MKITIQAKDRAELDRACKTIAARMSIDSIEVDENRASIKAGQWIAQEDAADMLGVSRGRVPQLISSGIFSSLKQEGRTLVCLQEVEQRMENPPAPYRPTKKVRSE